MMTEFLTRFRFLIFCKKRSELDDELWFHLEQSIAAKVAAGLTASEARRQALIEFGGVERTREQCDQQRPGSWMGAIAQDVRYGLRMLRKSPSFTFVAMATLALGIGANAVVFSLLNSLVLRPLNVPEGQNIYQIEYKGGDPSQSYPDYLDLRDRNRSFDGLAAYEISTAALDSDGRPVPVWLYTASGNYFDVLGIHPYLGRFFHGTDEHGPNSAPYIVLSYPYWQSHFQGDRGMVGRVVRLNKYNYTGRTGTRDPIACVRFGGWIAVGAGGYEAVVVYRVPGHAPRSAGVVRRNAGHVISWVGGYGDSGTTRVVSGSFGPATRGVNISDGSKYSPFRLDRKCRWSLTRLLCQLEVRSCITSLNCVENRLRVNRIESLGRQ